ncbi:MAG: hypothetical protein WBO34_06045 [Gammaproteobacteria bacterium]
MGQHLVVRQAIPRRQYGGGHVQARMFARDQDQWALIGSVAVAESREFGREGHLPR